MTDFGRRGPAAAILGDGTAGLTLRQFILTIENGTVGDSLKCKTMVLWNHSSIASVNNIAKDATTSGWTLDATGKRLTIESAILEGYVRFAFASIYRNYITTYIIDAEVKDLGGDISIRITQQPAGGILAITDLVNTGFIELSILYLTT